MKTNKQGLQRSEYAQMEWVAQLSRGFIAALRFDPVWINYYRRELTQALQE